MRAMLLMLGLPDMAIEQMLVIIALAVACAFMLAWIADAILGDSAFGVIVNTGILLAGAIVGTVLWRKFGFSFRFNPYAVATVVAAAAGLLTLVVCSALRRWI